MAQLAINDDVVNAFKEVSKRPQKAAYLIAKLNEDQNEIILDVKGEKTASFDDFKGCFPDNEPRFAVIDFKWDRDDGRKGTCITAVNWNPDSGSDAAAKFIFANNFENFKSKVQPSNKS